MDIKDRVKQVRLENGISQSDFARRIGLAQSSYSKLEIGINPVQDRHILTICSEFGISDAWLRTGEGDMYADEDAILLESLSKRYNLNESRLAILRAFLKLDDAQQDALLALAHQIVAEQNAADAAAAAQAAAIAARDALIEERDAQSSPDDAQANA